MMARRLRVLAHHHTPHRFFFSFSLFIYPPSPLFLQHQLAASFVPLTPPTYPVIMISSSTDTDRINALTIEEAPFSYRQIFTARGARAVLFDLPFFIPFFFLARCTVRPAFLRGSC
jgi:hypothetical protein